MVLHKKHYTLQYFFKNSCLTWDSPPPSKSVILQASLKGSTSDDLLLVELSQRIVTQGISRPQTTVLQDRLSSEDSSTICNSFGRTNRWVAYLYLPSSFHLSINNFICLYCMECRCTMIYLLLTFIYISLKF